MYKYSLTHSLTHSRVNSFSFLEKRRVFRGGEHYTPDVSIETDKSEEAKAAIKRTTKVVTGQLNRLKNLIKDHSTLKGVLDDEKIDKADTEKLLEQFIAEGIRNNKSGHHKYGHLYGMVIQHALFELNFFKGNNRDGFYGSKTKAAVEKFQNSVSTLKADGVAGRGTMKALLEQLRAAKKPVEVKQKYVKKEEKKTEEERSNETQVEKKQKQETTQPAKKEIEKIEKKSEKKSEKQPEDKQLLQVKSGDLQKGETPVIISNDSYFEPKEKVIKDIAELTKKKNNNVTESISANQKDKTILYENCDNLNEDDEVIKHNLIKQVGQLKKDFSEFKNLEFTISKGDNFTTDGQLLASATITEGSNSSLTVNITEDKNVFLEFYINDTTDMKYLKGGFDGKFYDDTDFNSPKEITGYEAFKTSYQKWKEKKSSY